MPPDAAPTESNDMHQHHRHIDRIAAAIALASLATTASADVTIAIDGFAAGGLEFVELVPAGSITGALTGISVSAALEETRAFTFAQDLCVYVCEGELDFGGPVQMGGFSELAEGFYEMWHGLNDGESHLVGTPLNAICTLGSPLAFDDTDLRVHIGNGYGTPGAYGRWTGYVTLHGVDQIGGRDSDGDGVLDSIDNCNGIPNPAQYDCDGNGIGDACEIDLADCNGNGRDDACDLGDPLLDGNDDGLIDTCQYAQGDLDFDGTVGGEDLLIVLANWLVPTPSQPDITGDGMFDGSDLAVVLANWGNL